MGVFEQEFDLPQMKEYIESQLSNVRLISDLALSESDFKYLGAKLKSAFSFTELKDGIEEIMICFLVYWVYALIYWDEDKGIHDELTEYFNELPQYQIRRHFQLLVDTFADYGLNDFGYRAESVEDQCSMLIARHAGIPDEEKYQVFELIDDYRNHNVSVDGMIEDICRKMPYRSRYIFSLLDSVSRWDMIWEVRTTMAVISSKIYTRDDILRKYPNISVSLIDHCFSWQQKGIIF